MKYEYQRRPLPPKGSLTELSVAELLHAANTQAYSGALRLRREAVEKLLFILDGQLAFVESDLRSETLGAYLLREGKIDAVEHRLIIEKMRQTGRRQGDLLIEHGLLGPHELFDAMLGHVTEKVIACFAWSDGDFELEPGSLWSTYVLNLKIEPSRLVLDGLHRHQQLDKMPPLSALGSTARAYLRDDAPPRTDRLRLTTSEARIYDLARTGAQVADLVSCCAEEPADTLRSLYGMFLLELLGFEEGLVRKSYQIPQHTPTPRRLAEAEQRRKDPGVAEDVVAEYLRLKDADHFTLLGVSREAKPGEIHEAFRQLSKRYSPKALKDLPPEVAECAKELYAKLLGAYKELANPRQKRLYEDQLDREPETPQRRSTEPPQPAVKAEATARSLESDDLFREAQEALGRDAPEAAVAKLTEALALKENEPLYLSWLGWALYRADPVKNRKRAERNLELARRSQPEAPEPYHFMAKILERQGEAAKAADLYSTAARLARGNVELAREANLGVIRMKKGKPKKQGAATEGTTGDRVDSALNLDVGELLRGLFSRGK